MKKGELSQVTVSPGSSAADLPSYRLHFPAPRGPEIPNGVPTVGDVFFLYLMRHQFARIRIQTARYSSSLMATGSGDAWVHVVRDSTAR